MSAHEPVEIDGLTGEVIDYPTSHKRYRAKLDTLQDVKREMAKVYRESRSGLVDIQDATKHVWVLQALGKVIVDADLEQRIDRLEKLSK
jgi:hypothetical protein